MNDIFVTEREMIKLTETECENLLDQILNEGNNRKKAIIELLKANMLKKVQCEGNDKYCSELNKKIVKIKKQRLLLESKKKKK